MSAETKSRVVDCVNHPETSALMRHMKAAPVPRQATGPTPTAALEGLRQRGMEAMASVKGVVAQVGLAPVVAGAAVYAAHIRQVDRERQAQRSPRVVNQGIERLG